MLTSRQANIVASDQCTGSSRSTGRSQLDIRIGILQQDWCSRTDTDWSLNIHPRRCIVFQFHQVYSREDTRTCNCPECSRSGRLVGTRLLALGIRQCLKPFKVTPIKLSNRGPVKKLLFDVSPKLLTLFSQLIRTVRTFLGEKFYNILTVLMQIFITYAKLRKIWIRATNANGHWKTLERFRLRKNWGDILNAGTKVEKTYRQKVSHSAELKERPPVTVRFRGW